MALFAVMDNTIATRIVRVELDRTASSSVTAIFQQQCQHFESHHNNKIPFYAGYTQNMMSALKFRISQIRLV
jgi:hypothetical protein